MVCIKEGGDLLRVVIIEDCNKDSDVIVSYMKRYSSEINEEIKL